MTPLQERRLQINNMYFLLQNHKNTGKVLATLTLREEMVIRRRAGLSNENKMTLQQIADICGVTRERIRQIEAKALRKLSHPTRMRELNESPLN